MRLQRIAGVSALFITVGLALAAYFLGSDLFNTVAGAENHFRYQEPPSQLVNPIARENTEPGTTSWRIPPGKEATIEIQAYASATSILPGHWLTFYVSTLRNGTPYFINIYRLGWYNGFGGRLMAQIPAQSGQRQGYYDATVHVVPRPRLVGCATCRVDTKTGLVEANWSPSYHLFIPSDWTTGVYLAKFIDSKGKQAYVPFDVLGNSKSVAVAVTPDTTYAAYNDWGGYSLYDADSNGIGAAASETDTTVPAVDNNGQIVRGVKVSFDRPYVQEYGASQVLVFEADAIRWLERQGYDLAYISNVDLQNNPAQILNRRVYVSLGHDEYWTKEMRDGVELARDSGVGLAFLGANVSYWQMRFEPDSHGFSNRTVVCYKVDSGLGPLDLARDPLYNVDNSRVTSRWRDPVVNRPENAMVGVMYSGLTHSQLGFPWQLDPKANSPLLNGTSLLSGKLYGCGLVGYEWDRVFNNGTTPPGLKVIGTSSTENNFNKSDSSNTTYYIAKSGAMVFASGSIYWETALDNYRSHADQLCFGHTGAIPGIQRLMANVMAALVHRYQPGQTVPVVSQVLPAPEFPIFFPLQRPWQYITLKWESLLPICVALVSTGLYMLRKRLDDLARRRFL